MILVETLIVIIIRDLCSFSVFVFTKFHHFFLYKTGDKSKLGALGTVCLFGI